MRACWLKIICFASFFLLVSLQSVESRSQPQSTAMGEADKLYQAQKWPEAAKAYEAVTKAEPANSIAWFKLGLSLHSSGEYARAIAAFEQFERLQPQQPQGMYRIGRAYAKLGDKDKAIEWLNKAIQAGFLNLQQFSSDPDIASLRDDPRFKELSTRLTAASRPCAVKPEYRQLDFFIGEWDSQNAQGQTVQSTSVKLDLENCVLIQDDKVPNGYHAIAWHFYNAALGKWQQKYIDTLGAFTDWDGEVKAGEIRYTEIAAPGAKAVHRSTFTQLAPDRVRQIWEQSNDGGKTWTRAEYTYIRKKVGG